MVTAKDRQPSAWNPAAYVDVDPRLVTTFVATRTFDPERLPRPTVPQSLPRRFHRYERQELCGAGGSGLVYKGHGDDVGPVALKTLHHLDASALAQLKNEFRALTQLRHDNLVRLHELGVSDDTWFIAMEWIDGDDLLQHLRPKGQRPSNAELRMALCQLALAIDATHRAGFLHLDIKPSNVLVTDEGRVVLLDFGLAAHARTQTAPQGLRTRGTPAYMAPEQINGTELSEATDWYAFGGVLHHLLTGTLPFEGDHLLALLGRKLLERPKKITDAGDPELARLAEALLHPDPCQRPTREAVFSALHLSEGPRLQRGRFQGRGAELEQLQGQFEAAKHSPTVVRLSGPSGMGKTRLTEAFLDSLEGAEVFYSRSFERAQVPYRAFDNCLDSLAQLLRNNPPAPPELLASPEFAQLQRLFPALRNLPGVPKGAIALLPPAEARQRAFAGLAKLLAHLTEDRVLVLALDDVQWSDADSALLLDHLLHSEHLPRLFVLLTDRGQGPSPLLNLVEKHCRHISLNPLAPAEAIAMASSLFATADGVRDRRIATQAQGRPLLIEEFAEKHAEGLTPQAPELSSVGELVVARLAKLPSLERRLVETVCIADRPLALPQLLRGLLHTEGSRGEPNTPDERSKNERAKGELNGAIAILCESRLLRQRQLSGRPFLEPYHAQTQHSVLAQMPEARRIHRHLRFIEAQSEVDTAPAQFAYHFRQGGDLQRANHWSLKAAVRAEASLAFTQAAQHYEDILRTPGEGERTELQLRYAEALGNAGKGRLAAETLLRCIAKLPDEAQDLRRRAAEYYLIGAEMSRGRKVLQRALDDAGLTQPTQPKALVAHIAWNMLRLRLRGLEHPEPQQRPEGAGNIDLLLAGMRGYATHSPLVAAHFALEALRASLENGYLRGLVLALDYYAIMTLNGGRPAAVRRGYALLDDVAELCRDAPDPYLRSRRALGRSVAATALGKFRECVEQCELSTEELERCVGTNWELAVLENNRIRNLFWLGDLPEARQRLRHLHRRAAETEDRYTRLIGIANEAFLRLVDGEPGTVETQLRALLDEWEAKEFTFLHFFANEVLIDAYLYEGRIDAAERQLQELLAQLRPSGLLSFQLMRCTTSYLEGNVALAQWKRGKRPQRNRLRVRRLARWLEGTGHRYAVGYAHCLRAGFDGYTGPHAEAALAAFEDAEMSLHSDALRLAQGDGEAARRMQQRGVAAPVRWSRVYLGAL